MSFRHIAAFSFFEPVWTGGYLSAFNNHLFKGIMREIPGNQYQVPGNGHSSIDNIRNRQGGLCCFGVGRF